MPDRTYAQRAGAAALMSLLALMSGSCQHSHRSGESTSIPAPRHFQIQVLSTGESVPHSLEQFVLKTAAPIPAGAGPQFYISGFQPLKGAVEQIPAMLMAAEPVQSGAKAEAEWGVPLVLESQPAKSAAILRIGDWYSSGLKLSRNSRCTFQLGVHCKDKSGRDLFTVVEPSVVAEYSGGLLKIRSGP